MDAVEPLKARHLLKHNIEALLSARHQKQHELANYCRRSDGWLTRILSDENGEGKDRQLPLKYLDKIAEFFGIATYQLFQPGISALLERRSGFERRRARDRRISQAVLPHKPLDVDLVDVFRALSLPGREEALEKARAIVADILNRELRRPPSKAAVRDVPDRTAGTGVGSLAPARDAKKGRQSRPT